MPRVAGSSSSNAQCQATVSKSNSSTARGKVNENYDHEDPREIPDSQPCASADSMDSPPLQTSNFVGAGVKRPATSLDNEDDSVEQSVEVTSEMQKLLESFGVDIGNRRCEETWKVQLQERQKIRDNFQKQAVTIFNQWEVDLQKTKENEEKLQAQLRQQQKVFQQVRMVQSQRLKSMKDLHEWYYKSMDDVDKQQQEQHSVLQVEFKEELSLLQKNILMEAQQHEVSNVRKSLQAMFY